MSPVEQKQVLVVCYSRLISDPRVIRQLQWFDADGWTVDTLGFGPAPAPTVREHFELGEPGALLRNGPARLAAHALLPRSTSFAALEESRIPRALRTPEGLAEYDLVFVNDVDLLPWADRMSRASRAAGQKTTFHLDLHEYHQWENKSGLPGPVERILARDHEWLVSFVGSGAFHTRSTVADGIADLYSDRFDVDELLVVRNTPDPVEQGPSTVDPDRIELLYHGNADLARGLQLLIQAMEEVDSRFHLTLMLTGLADGKDALLAMTEHLSDRVTFVDPVPMARVAREINKYDLEVIFYPPTGPNYLHSFPNKFFESVQGRMGVVIGHSPSMEGIVSQFGNGVVVEGWSSSDLARTLNSLTAEQIEQYKRGASAAAAELNSEQELLRFRASITPASAR